MHPTGRGGLHRKRRLSHARIQRHINTPFNEHRLDVVHIGEHKEVNDPRTKTHRIDRLVCYLKGQDERQRGGGEKGRKCQGKNVSKYFYITTDIMSVASPYGTALSYEPGSVGWVWVGRDTRDQFRSKEVVRDLSPYSAVISDSFGTCTLREHSRREKVCTSKTMKERKEERRFR